MSTVDERLSFLSYVYLKITPEDLRNTNNPDIVKKIIGQCSYRAYQDLKRRVPYEYSSNAVEKLDENTKTEFRKKKEKFLTEIYETINNNLTDDKGMFKKIINPREIIEDVIIVGKKNQAVFKNDKNFTVGLAQKWVNMTLKYLWILGVVDAASEAELEVPIDSYILEELCELGLDVKYIKWSTWNDFLKYVEIQEELKKIITNEFQTRIAWENEAWIKVAEMKKQ